MNLEQKEILRKKRILEYAEANGNILKTCRHFGVSRSNFYIWRTAYRHRGDAGLVPKKPIARSDQEEFYQLLDYTDDIDLKRKLADWEKFYNFSRPHGAFNGRTPYEALREKLWPNLSGSLVRFTPSRAVRHLETTAKLLRLQAYVSIDFSKCTLKSLNNQSDFDSAIRRFDSSRPSHN